MRGYSSEIPDDCATARLEEVNASYKDLAEVCGRIRSKKADWALSFLEKASKGEVPVLYRKRNTRLGHRRQLRGRKGRYPKKAAMIVLKVLKSAMANARVLGLGDEYTIFAASANKKHIYPRIAPKGRWARSFLETSRVEIVLKGKGIPKGVTVTPPKKEKEPEAKKEEKKAEKKEEKKPEAKKEEEKEEEKKEPPKLLEKEGKEHHEHKHDMEKAHEHEKKREEKPHQHGEHDTR